MLASGRHLHCRGSLDYDSRQDSPNGEARANVPAQQVFIYLNHDQRGM